MDPTKPRLLERRLERAGLGGIPDDDAPILLVDDSPMNLGILVGTLRQLGRTLLVATDGEQCLKIARHARPALVLLDIMMPKMDGFEVCRRMKADPELEEIPVVFCSALDEPAARVRGLELGAVDFVTKPFDPAEIEARVTTHLAIHRLLHGMEARNRELARELAFAREARQDTLRRMQEVLVGTSAPVRDLRASVATLGRTEEAVLVVADAGCGDEAVARAIHEASARRDRPLLRLECPLLRAADVPAIFEANRAGAISRLESARGGTVFFEGIHRMPADLYEPLFALIEALDAALAEGRAHPLDVRVICSALTSGTSGEPREVLEAWRRRARTRKTLWLPTLAERRDDIPALVAFFAERHARLVGRTFETVADDTLAALARHWWPGNLRELEEVVRGGVLRSQRSTLEIDVRVLTDGIPFGSYRLLEKLAEGGMGTLWEARHQLLARPAVVKLIRGHASIDREEQEQRFELEARATAHLRSPHTVTLFDYGVSDEGDFYYVMEKLEGIDLDAAVTTFGRMPAARVVSLLIQACRSLAEAHAIGLVHRDIKPANLFLCKLGVEVDVLKVLDFGVVRWTTSEETRITSAGTLCGTPGFMSPEAVLNREELDGATDIYALGCVAYWLLTAQFLFEAPTPLAAMMRHVMEEPEPPSRHALAAVPEALEALIMRCLAKPREDRPTALELLSELTETHLADGWTSTDALRWWIQKLPEKMGP